MRLFLLLTLTAAAGVARAQTPDAARALPPDTTAPWRYYPLAVGDVWEYAIEGSGGGLRIRHARDTTIGGRPYVVQVREWFDAAGQPAPPPYPGYNLQASIRFDTATTHARQWVSQTIEPPFIHAACPFGAANGEEVDCGAMGGTALVQAFEGTLTVGDTLVPGVRVKRYVIYNVGFVTYVAGVGEVEREDKFSPYTYITYARVGGVEYGAPRFTVEAEPDPKGVGAPALSMGPNPAHAHATATFTLEQAGVVRVEVFDTLGRRVLTRNLGTLAAGRHEAPLDLAALAPGPYAVRVVAGERTAVRTLTVAR